MRKNIRTAYVCFVLHHSVDLMDSTYKYLHTPIIITNAIDGFHILTDYSTEIDFFFPSFFHHSNIETDSEKKNWFIQHQINLHICQ